MKKIKALLTHETAAGAVLLLAALLAMLAVNSPLSTQYELLHAHGPHLVINEMLMALFFLCAGVEIKVEIKEGHLMDRRQRLLPLLVALGGMVAPALIYLHYNPAGRAAHGWAIPTATDIALGLGALSLFGRRVPPALRIFLLCIAVFDDVMGIAIIALFYTGEIQWPSLWFSLGCCVLLAMYNRKVTNTAPYILAGAGLWVALLDAGISPTVAGVVLGFAMPLGMGKRVMKRLHAPVMFGVLPLFVFANAGIPFDGLSVQALSQPLAFGVLAGLFAGKQIGIFLTTLLAVTLRIATKPAHTSWLQIYGVSLLCGIGFTVSLFVGTLAFGHGDEINQVRAGVLTGSLASAIAGTICMSFALRKAKTTA